MRKLRIKGLVSIADSVRRELALPVSNVRKTELRAFVHRALREVDRIAARNGTTAAALPPPSRRAYAFLADLNFEKLACGHGPLPVSPSRANTSLVGLRAYIDRTCGQLAIPLEPERRGQLHESIRATSKNVEQHLNEKNLTGADLTNSSRSARGWLAFFAQSANFDAYVAAVGRARKAFEDAIDRYARFSRPALVEFKPTRGLYRIRGERHETRAVLATPMICFSDEHFHSVAQAAIRAGSKQKMMEAACDEAYQRIQAELDALGGIEDRAAGIHRSLQTSFDRVVAGYFGGNMARPRLAWSRTFTGRTFGHYDPVGDSVMISCTLDRADVPEFVLDSVMHHELLHKKLGVYWHDGRMNAHSPEFRREEKRFAQYEEADLFLKRLAGAL